MVALGTCALTGIVAQTRRKGLAGCLLVPYRTIPINVECLVAPAATAVTARRGTVLNAGLTQSANAGTVLIASALQGLRRCVSGVPAEGAQRRSR